MGVLQRIKQGFFQSQISDSKELPGESCSAKPPRHDVAAVAAERQAMQEEVREEVRRAASHDITSADLQDSLQKMNAFAASGQLGQAAMIGAALAKNTQAPDETGQLLEQFIECSGFEDRVASLEGLGFENKSNTLPAPLTELIVALCNHDHVDESVKVDLHQCYEAAKNRLLNSDHLPRCLYRPDIEVKLEAAHISPEERARAPSELDYSVRTGFKGYQPGC